MVQLDDFLIVGRTYEEVLERVDRLIRILERFGLPINEKKSQLVPVQAVDYLSYHLDFKTHKLFTKRENLEKAAEMIDKISPGEIRNEDLQSLVGTITANAPSQAVIDELAPVRQGIIYGEGKGDVVTYITEEAYQVLLDVQDRCEEEHDV